MFLTQFVQQVEAEQGQVILEEKNKKRNSARRRPFYPFLKTVLPSCFCVSFALLRRRSKELDIGGKKATCLGMKRTARWLCAKLLRSSASTFTQLRYQTGLWWWKLCQCQWHQRYRVWETAWTSATLLLWQFWSWSETSWISSKKPTFCKAQARCQRTAKCRRRGQRLRGQRCPTIGPLFCRSATSWVPNAARCVCSISGNQSKTSN